MPLIHLFGSSVSEKTSSRPICEELRRPRFTVEVDGKKLIELEYPQALHGTGFASIQLAIFTVYLLRKVDPFTFFRFPMADISN